MSRVLFFLAGLAVALALPAQQCTQGPPTTLGTVTPLTGPCPGGTGGFPRTTCLLLQVQCAGIPTIAVQVRISEPPAGVPLRGTVVLGVGGGGVGFYGQRPGGRDLVLSLLQAGFRVVDRSWLTSWFGSRVSVRKQSCRYATLLTWIYKNVYTRGAFCATGNSGGSAEIGYALSTWGRGAILDVAVLTGGPPMARLDYLCFRSQQWQTLCRSLIPPGVWSCTPSCNQRFSHPVCSGSCATNPTPKDLEADSILHPNAATAYPRTRVHILLGTEDCSSAVPQAFLFYRAVVTEKVIQYVPGTPHWVAATAAGRAAILRALLAGAACRPGPAVMAAETWPQVGGGLRLRLHGPASAPYAVFLSLGATQLELPGLGWILLAPPWSLLGTGTLDANGRGTFGFPVPAYPPLAGLLVYLQGALGPCLTNLEWVRLRP